MDKKIKKVNHKEFTEAYLKIVRWFFSFPKKEMSLNDLCHELKISKTTGNRVVTQLVNEDFLRREILGKLWRITSNQQHEYFTTKKVSHNLELIYESGIIEFIHEKITSPRTIILFGSYRKGDDTEKSDIDIAVEVLGDKEVKIWNAGAVPELGYRKDVPLNVYIFSRNKIDLNLFSNIANGIVLEGFLEVRP